MSSTYDTFAPNEAEGSDDGQPNTMSVSDEDAAQRNKRCLNWTCTKAFLIKWHLPLLLVFAVVLGYLWPYPGAQADAADLGGVCFGSNCVWNSISSLCVTLIFFMSGMKLKTDEIKNAVKAWKAVLFGMISILFITPLVSFAVVNLRFGPVVEFGVGLALFFCMPTTLSSGPIIVGQAKGSTTLALLLTVTTNLIGIFTAPLILSGVLNSQLEGGVAVEPLPIILKLVFTILLPLVAGKLLRKSSRVVNFTKKYGLQMKILSSVLLGMIPWMKISANADSFKSVEAGALVGSICVGMAVHILYLGFNYSCCRWALKLALDEKKAVTIVCSQKTLPVAVTILEYLPNTFNKGIVVIPIIGSHLMQIVIDAFVAAKWATVQEESPISNKDNTATNSDEEEHQVVDADIHVESLQPC